LNALEEGGSNSHGKVFERQEAPSLYEQALRAPRRVKLLAAIVAALTLYWLAGGTFVRSPIKHTQYTLVQTRVLGYGGRWPGFKKLQHLVIFGDSYSETAFNPDGPLPTPEDALGNPPDHAAWTSANGPNWAIFLPTVYNQSLLRTVNLAAGGATMDQDLVPQHMPTVRSMKKQVVDVFAPKFGGWVPPANFSWKPEDSLFIFWQGINDVHNTFSWSNKSETQYKVLQLYAQLVDKVYENGARNFLFLTIPPTDLSPLTMHEGPEVQAAERADIKVWNDNVLDMAKQLFARYNDVSTFVFDTHALFSEIIANPCSYAETCAYQNTDEWCPGYKTTLKTWYDKIDECDYAIDEYFWKDALHPTFRVHNATAKAIANFLSLIPAR